MGCAICLIGSVIIILHAPADKDVQTVDEILEYAMRPGFLCYVFFVAVFSTVMIYVIAPRFGRKNPMVYISICSTVGSVSVMAIKGFGIALKLTFAGNNQFSHPSTYVFAIVVVVCILTQMNYFNKALDQFDTSIVNPLYYVTFTTATLCASFLLFSGFNTTNASNSVSLICGFLIIFAGVYLLNVSRGDNIKNLFPSKAIDGMPMDNMMAGVQTRHSLQLQRASMQHRRSASMRSHDARLLNDMEEESLGLTRLDDDYEYGRSNNNSNSSLAINGGGSASGTGSKSQAEEEAEFSETDSLDFEGKDRLIRPKRTNSLRRVM